MTPATDNQLPLECTVFISVMLCSTLSKYTNKSNLKNCTLKPSTNTMVASYVAYCHNRRPSQVIIQFPQQR
jgi:hypothetical protein